MPRTEAGKRLLDRIYDDVLYGKWLEVSGDIVAVEAEAAALDEERLARAIGVVIADRGGPIEWPDAAAAIAKAYREDTDA